MMGGEVSVNVGMSTDFIMILRWTKNPGQFSVQRWDGNRVLGCRFSIGWRGERSLGQWRDGRSNGIAAIIGEY